MLHIQNDHTSQRAPKGPPIKAPHGTMDPESPRGLSDGSVFVGRASSFGRHRISRFRSSPVEISEGWFGHCLFNPCEVPFLSDDVDGWMQFNVDTSMYTLTCMCLYIYLSIHIYIYILFLCCLHIFLGSLTCVFVCQVFNAGPRECLGKRRGLAGFFCRVPCSPWLAKSQGSMTDYTRGFPILIHTHTVDGHC